MAKCGRIKLGIYPTLSYDPMRASRIIATCICLRNLQLTYREPSPTEENGSNDDNIVDDDNDAEEDGDTSTPISDSGTAVMEAIVANYF